MDFLIKTSKGMLHCYICILTYEMIFIVRTVEGIHNKNGFAFSKNFVFVTTRFETLYISVVGL